MRLQVKRSSDAISKGRLVSAIRTYLPGAWVSPGKGELIALYRLRYKMALDEQKYDTAIIFLNKVLEVEPLDIDAKLCKAELYHRHLSDFTQAIEHYNKVIRLTADKRNDARNVKARSSICEIMEMLS